MTNTAFYYDPDFRRSPKDEKKPYCVRCQQNVNIKTAIAISANDETWMAIEGHDNHEVIRTNFNPHNEKRIFNGYIGKDCYKKVKL